MLWALLAAVAAYGEPPQAPAPAIAPAPVRAPPPVDTLGGLTQGAPFNPEGFTCKDGWCEKPAEIAALPGTLFVATCSGRIHQIGFQRRFYTPDAVAIRLDKPKVADSRLWMANLGTALEQVGFVPRKPTVEEAAEFTRLAGPAQLSATGRQLAKPDFLIYDHPDGRVRLVSIIEGPGPADAVAANVEATVVKVTLTAPWQVPCTAGL